MSGPSPAPGPRLVSNVTAGAAGCRLPRPPLAVRCTDTDRTAAYLSWFIDEHQAFHSSFSSVSDAYLLEEERGRETLRVEWRDITLFTYVMISANLQPPQVALRNSVPKNFNKDFEVFSLAQGGSAAVNKPCRRCLDKVLNGLLNPLSEARSHLLIPNERRPALVPLHSLRRERCETKRDLNSAAGGPLS
ncbi:hypothetical protein EVAR_61992_1 [Eumeta japonica]|uniref:Uncharacterized protein n=1 Tax=Eumeta variegata TaxID=151549 RepID=A0A4C1YJK1_EUMVA|nr:hypothetical protein EVAR_61992_1 [Eumeta japonica]